MAFKHGVYAEHVKYDGKSLMKSIGTIPCYIGTAPINQVNVNGEASFDYSGSINVPMLINTYAEAKEKLGVSDDFGKFTLMEAIYAHFLNDERPIAPIVVINMANPATRESTDTEATMSLTGATANKVGYIDDDEAVIETLAISTLVAGTDYTAEWVEGKIKVNITKSGYTADSVTVTYRKIDVTDTVITSAAFSTALEAIDLCETVTGIIPNIVASPHYTELKAYHDLLITKVANKISNKWNLIAVVDIEANSTTNTIAKAITKKATDAYTNALEKVCFPMVKYKNKIYHLSTMAVVDMQLQDTLAGGVPYVSPSNKIIYADAAVLADGTQLFINETTANTANANGLTTTNIIRGAIRLWGGNNGNYSYTNESNIDPEYRQDASIRMMLYMQNKLQYDYIDSVDNPIARRDVDSILASIQQWLNSLVNEGKLLYATIEFVENSNSVNDMVSGDFVFDVATTTTPNAKSLTFKAKYTTEGIEALTGGEE